MDSQSAVGALRACQSFFDRSSACLTEEHSAYKPTEAMMTTAQQVAHVALTIDWFVEGAFREEGFDMDFESHLVEAARASSLAAARAQLAASFERACEVFAAKSPAELAAPLPEGPVMGGLPRFAVVSGIEDHTAHHRGTLTVYARLCGLEPAMPYM